MATEAATPSPAAVRGSHFALSPINRRRWRNFKSNRRGYWALWLFLFIFVVTLFAELVANSRPLLIVDRGHLYWPAFTSYTETDFGGDFETEADFRDPFVAKLLADRHAFVLWPPIRFSYDTINRNLPQPAPSAPTWTLADDQCKAAAERVGGKTCRDIEWNWLGTDDNARDVLARIIYGTRISILFGLILTFFSSIIGILAGAVQGYFGGWVDITFQRAIEIWTSVPSLYLLIIISAVLAPGFWILLGILLLFSWTTLVPLVRAEFLRARNFEYVRAARALGLSNTRIIWKHLLPNATVATLTMLPFILSGSISTLTALDYLGFGLPPGTASLGELLQQGQAKPDAYWLSVTGFAVMAVILSLLIFIGEAVRDALDPRKTFN
ncbi:ABC transporter permease [Labrys monachus]|uniref:Microcin C transport system permease protein n=1 Tax=Labrys monachus TaxID=217067 RepID=A0ABU0FMF3_9HYPH|nr:ABC transporter permease [Labrys monachus]MDQ0395788.1 microcin C transport system permease protein [Labrys monachus]